MEQTGENPDTSCAEKIIEKPVTQTQGKTQQVANTRVQHVVPLLQIVKKTVEVPEVSLLQFTNKVADIPVVAQRQICVNQEVQKTIEISQLQYTDEVIDVPVVSIVQVPRVWVVKKTVEDPQFEIVEKTLRTQRPRRFRARTCWSHKCKSWRRQQRSHSCRSSRKSVKFRTNEVSEKSQDCMVCSSASGSTRQQHKQRATTQTAQEEERGSTTRSSWKVCATLPTRGVMTPTNMVFNELGNFPGFLLLHYSVIGPGHG